MGQRRQDQQGKNSAGNHVLSIKGSRDFVKHYLTD